MQVFWNTPILYFVRRFEIAESPFFEKYINQYDTIFLNMQEVLNAIWMKRPEQVAEGIRQAHFETSYIYSKKKISGKAGTGRRA